MRIPVVLREFQLSQWNQWPKLQWIWNVDIFLIWREFKRQHELITIAWNWLDSNPFLVIKFNKLLTTELRLTIYVLLIFFSGRYLMWMKIDIELQVAFKRAKSIIISCVQLNLKLNISMYVSKNAELMWTNVIVHVAAVKS